MFGKRFYPACVAMALASATSLTFADDKTQEVEQIQVRTIKKGESVGGRVLIFKNDQSGDDGRLLRVYFGDDDGIAGPNAEWMSVINTKASRYMIGVECEPVSDLLRHHLDLDAKIGLAIQNVIDDSAAHKAGLQEHDILVQLGDSPISSIGDVGKVLDKSEGAEIDVHFIRRGEKQTAKITPIERKPINKRKFTLKHESGESNVDIDVEAITEGILSVSPGLRFKANSQIKDALKQAISAQGTQGNHSAVLEEQLSSQQNQRTDNRIQRLEELQKKQSQQLEQQIKELKQMIEKLSEASDK